MKEKPVATGLTSGEFLSSLTILVPKNLHINQPPRPSNPWPTARATFHPPYQRPSTGPTVGTITKHGMTGGSQTLLAFQKQAQGSQGTDTHSKTTRG